MLPSTSLSHDQLENNDWSNGYRTPCIAKIITSLSFSAIMANPRKFSEKIALHNQKQAEETAAFEAIIKEVTSATRVSIAAICGLVSTAMAVGGGAPSQFETEVDSYVFFLL